MGLIENNIKCLSIKDIFRKKKEWVGLTAQDLADVGVENVIGAVWADAKLKEKNGN